MRSLPNTYETGLLDCAITTNNGRGRLYPEAESPTRTPVQRDRDRVIHCSTFRRLKHKTQVFVFHEEDYYRTRLTHSIEVAQIARSICRSLRLNEDLAEALSLAHDFGHTPFGHAGEEALDACMLPYGGFDHNAQSLRLVTKLERRYASFEGLNLTWDTLEGLAKHNGPLIEKPFVSEQPPTSVPWALREYLLVHDLEVHTYPSAEAQVAALADDIAYNNHDIDDGLRAGLFTLSQISDVAFVGRTVAAVKKLDSGMGVTVLTHEVVRRLINQMVNDLLHHTQARLSDLKPQHPNDVRNAANATVAFSDSMNKDNQELKTFLRENMYRHHRVNRMNTKAKKVILDLFNLYLEQPNLLDPQWTEFVDTQDPSQLARAVADFIAGMTDRFALRQHRKLFDITTFEI